MRPAAAVSLGLLLLASAGSGQTLFGAEADVDHPTEALPYDPTPRDPRFFGHWCQVGRIRPCRDVPRRVGLGPFEMTFGTQRVCADVEGTKAEVRYLESSGVGRLRGFGEGSVDGERFGLVLTGTVERVSMARLAAHVGRLDRVDGWAVIGGDGLSMQVAALDEVMTLRKDACGNAPPRVRLVSQSGSTLVWGRRHCFEGSVTQDEDASFPASRMVMESSKGIPFGIGALPPVMSADGRRVTRCTSGFEPGSHLVTFTATDAGGLSASDSVRVEVTNRKPLSPFVVQPRPDATIVARGAQLFEAKAFDPEDGLLDGASIQWGVKGATGGFVNLGSGRRLVASLPEPGPVTLRVVATDGAGETSWIDRELVVRPLDGDTPPRVAIEVPRHLDVPGRFAGTFPPGEVVFRGVAIDAEDAGPLDLRWEAERTHPTGASLPPVTGRTAAAFRLSDGGGAPAIWRITFSATDRGGLTGETVIEVLVTR